MASFDDAVAAMTSHSRSDWARLITDVTCPCDPDLAHLGASARNADVIAGSAKRCTYKHPSDLTATFPASHHTRLPFIKLPTT